MPKDIKSDLERIFADTPGKKSCIHLNNCGSSLMPQSVLQSQIDHLELEASIGGYEAANKRHDAIEAVYDSVARLINCHRDEVAVVENATVGWAMAFYAIPFQAGDRILTVEAEYASNYVAYLQIAKEKNVSVEVIPSDENGVISLETLEEMIDDRVRVISVTHVPTNSGLVNPVEEIGIIARKHNILYVVDACQSAGQMPLDVEKIQCDVLSATARKFLRGPRGVGFVYVRSSVIEHLHPPMIDLLSATWVSENEYVLRSDARRFENWENNYAAKLGMGACIDYALEIGLENVQARINELANYLRDNLRAIDGVKLHTLCPKQCGIVTFSISGKESADAVQTILKKGVNVSTSSPSSTLLDATKNNLPVLIRSSVHYYNDNQELDTFISIIREIAKE
ncbi:aminotransferase class V-fold PLP-dependent enzyme [Kiloniella majae]|uniref:aminotransferase class V-fold PLP-dependent enzyme n=1 Tax=Kiloniella majae TaxID=1938558 RepID=UPI000A278E19|nr:aminotransferase class V-fold PLP-dependent enzyme [Kiloniella majae]